MIKRLSYSIATAMLLLLALLWLYPTPKSQSCTIRVGYVSVSAQQADLSQQRATQCGLRGAELMAAQAFEENTLKGQTIEVLSLPVAEEQNWQESVLHILREKELAALFFAPGTPLPTALCHALEETSCPVFLASDEECPMNGAIPFRVVSTRSAMVQTVADYALSQHFRHIAVLVSDESGFQEQAELFLECLKAEQVKIDVQFHFTLPEYLPVSGEQSPEAFAVWGGKDFLIQTIRALRHTGYLGPILGSPDCGDPAVINALGIASNNIVFSAPYCIPRSTEEIESEILSALTSRYVQRYGEYPTSAALFSGYDQMLLFSKALSIHLAHPELALPQAVHLICDQKGMAGIFDFSSGRDGIDHPRVYTIESGAVIPAL